MARDSSTRQWKAGAAGGSFVEQRRAAPSRGSQEAGLLVDGAADRSTRGADSEIRRGPPLVNRRSGHLTRGARASGWNRIRLGSSLVGLVVGAVLFYVSFLFDCVDGKVARALGTMSPDGVTLDQIADGARRASVSLGLAVYLWKVADPNGADGRFFWAVVYGFLAFYFGLISGGTRVEASTRVGSRWSQWLARHRLLPTPGAPDAGRNRFRHRSSIGWVVPCLVSRLRDVGGRGRGDRVRLVRR